MVGLLSACVCAVGHSREFRLDWLEVDIPTQEGAWEPCENELHIIRMLGQYWLGTGIPAGRFFRAVGLCVCALEEASTG